MNRIIQAVFERSQELACILSADGKIIFANQAWTNHLGLVPLELTKRFFANFLHQQDADAFTYLLEESARTKEPRQLTCRMRHSNGSYLSCSCYLTIDQSNKCFILHLKTFSRAEDLIQRLDGALWQSALPHFDLTFFNPARAAELLKVSPKKIPKTNREALERIHKEDQKYLIQAFKDIRHLKRMRLEYRYLRPDGALRWLVDDIQLIEDENADPIAIQGLLYDRTEEKMHLNETNRLLKILENTPDLVSYVDAQGQAMYTNPAMRAYRGIAADVTSTTNSVATPAFERIKEAHPTWAKQVIMEQGIPEAIEKGVWHGRTAIYKCEEGHTTIEVPTEQTIISHKNEKGELEFLSTIIRDISQLVAQEEQLKLQNAALKEQSERTNLILASRKIGVWEWRASENTLIWDERMFDIYDLPRSHFKGTYDDWRSCIILEDRERVHSEVEKAIRGERDLSSIFRIKHRNGEMRHVASMASVLRNSDGQVNRFLGITWDVTEEKQQQEIQDQQRTSYVQNTRLAAIGEMAAAVAHEINNPLSIISGRAAQIVCALDMPPADPKEVRVFAQRIEDSVKRIARVIHSLKAFATGDDKLAISRTTTRSVVEEALNLCREKLRSHFVTLTLHVPEHIFIDCSAQHLSQVVLHLLNHSFDSVKDLKDKWIEIEAKETDFEVMIAVTDSSTETKKEFLNKIFQPVFGNKEVGHGVSLDLVSTKGIVNAHAGRIHYLQESPHTRFEIYIPKSKKAGAA